MSKKYFLGFNWKMNPNQLQTAKELYSDYSDCLSKDFNSVSGTNTQIVAFPPSLYLGILQNLVRDSKTNSENIKNSDFNKLLELGSQDISTQESGAFTGEISAKMLQDLNIKYTLVGHSETRETNSLNNQIVNQKIIQTLKNNLNPVLCIGYSKNPEVDLDELKTQILEGLKDCQQVFETNSKTNSDLKIILAYEPVWAIGSGKAASLEIVNEVLGFIKNLVKKEISWLENNFLILYGGSVSEENVLELTKSEFLDGFLIGGASLSKSKFEPIIIKLNSLNT